MNPELEVLLRAWDEFIQTPNGRDAERLYASYQTRLEEVVGRSKVSKATLHQAVKKYHERWVRANLPPGFPKTLGLK